VSEDAPLSFEDALSKLETLVDTLEQGDLSLDDSLKHFEHGIALHRTCHEALTEVEQKVRILESLEDNATLVPFGPNND
jgi:exodeoxyribonuclease VII small subunit